MIDGGWQMEAGIPHITSFQSIPLTSDKSLDMEQCFDLEPFSLLVCLFIYKIEVNAFVTQIKVDFIAK